MDFQKNRIEVVCVEWGWFDWVRDNCFFGYLICLYVVLWLVIDIGWVLGQGWCSMQMVYIESFFVFDL